MIRERIGNLVEEVEHGIIVQQVNAQGAMGSGIAKQILDKWPIVFGEYSAIVHPQRKDKGKQYMGMTIPVEVVEDKIIVCNIVGQQFYGKVPPAGAPEDFIFTDYEALEEGLLAVGDIARDIKWPIHLPLIGCGLARGDWNVVRKIIERQLFDCDVTIWRLKSDS